MTGGIGRRAGKKFPEILKIAAILAVTICFVFPFYISLVYSMKTPSDFGRNSLSLPTKLYFGNYVNVIRRNDAFLIGMLNSVLTTVPIVLMLTVFCAMAAYVLARRAGKSVNAIYYLFLLGILIPFQCIMFPTYVNLRAAGLMNTLPGYILVRTGFQIGICLLMITDYVKTVPRELEDAARIDGAGNFQTFWKIVFPLMKPINVTVMVINAVFAWNDFYVSVTILQSTEKRTLPLAQFVYISEAGVDINTAFAFFTLCMLPILAIYLFAQKYIVNGIMSGAVKG
jgi:raffinose/stachyose/melibiose transport system permease protein